MQQINTLYEDDAFIVFNKPPGILVIPSPKEKKNTLVHIVNQGYSNSLSGKLHPCHRLDKETSGSIVFAKGKKNQQLMMQLFHEKAVEKEYLAFVKGRLLRRRGVLNWDIADKAQTRYAKQSKPKPAVTRYKVVSSTSDFTVVKVFPETGRTNQIRIHFRMLGAPLLGERVYAFRKDFKVDFRRLALHAKGLSWKHPISQKRVTIEAEVPSDMKKFLDKYSLNL